MTKSSGTILGGERRPEGRGAGTAPRNRRPPPGFATWLLQHVGNRYQRDALIGDLIEEYDSGRSPAWYWQQVGLALLASGRDMLRRSSPPMCAVAKWMCVLLILSGGRFSCGASASEAAAFESGDKRRLRRHAQQSGVRSHRALAQCSGLGIVCTLPSGTGH